jgi:hypothetical protein
LDSPPTIPIKKKEEEEYKFGENLVMNIFTKYCKAIKSNTMDRIEM